MSHATKADAHATNGNGHSAANGHAPAARILTDEMVAEIQRYIPRYPSKRAVVLPALHIVNERLRQVPLQAVVEVAQLLDLAPAEVQDTLSFYGYFHQGAPHGKTRVMVCRSVSCALRGADELLVDMCQQAGVQPGGTTADGAFTLEFAECLGACEKAPCLLANTTLHACVTPQSAAGLMAQWRKE